MKLKTITITDDQGKTYTLNFGEQREFSTGSKGWYLRESFGPKTAKEFGLQLTITDNASVTPEVKANRLRKQLERLQAQVPNGAAS